MLCKGEFRRLERIARANGWTVSVTGGGHIRFRSPGGVIVFMPSTASDSRAWKNARAKLRREGLGV